MGEVTCAGGPVLHAERSRQLPNCILAAGHETPARLRQRTLLCVSLERGGSVAGRIERDEDKADVLAEPLGKPTPEGFHVLDEHRTDGLTTGVQHRQYDGPALQR